MNEEFEESMKRFNAKLNRCIPRVPPSVQQINKTLKPYVELQKKLEKSLFPILKSIEDINKLISPNLLRIVETLEKLPEKTKIAIMSLAEQGWFFDPEMSLPKLWSLNRLIEEGKIIELEDILLSHFESSACDIEQSLINRFPIRA